MLDQKKITPNRSRINGQVWGIILPSIIILAFIAIMNLFFGVPVTALMRDVAAIAKINPFYGVISELGLYLWCATGAICIFASVLIGKKQRNKAASFLCYSGFLAFYLMIDDAFLLHEHVLPKYLNITEIFVYCILGSTVICYLIIYRDFILKTTNYMLLVFALILLSLSVFFDTIGLYFFPTSQLQFFVEDGCKWLGIATYCSYYINTALLHVRLNFIND